MIIFQFYLPRGFHSCAGLQYFANDYKSVLNKNKFYLALHLTMIHM
jgi:succinate dehydrogenase/fumarate reductase cytochrome b subunit